MKYYKQFLNLGCFTFKEAVSIVGLEATTKTLLREYIKKGYISKVRRGLYVANDLLYEEPVVNKYVIGSNINESSIISHHAAFEYYGCYNQVSYEVCVSSEKRFNAFYFNYYYYYYINNTISKGIIEEDTGVRVTDMERTILDSIDNFDYCLGFGELIECLTLVPNIKENKIVEYLKEYDKKFLYQKTGYIFEKIKSELNISQDLIDICRNKAGKSSRYLMKDIPKEYMKFNSKWHIAIPDNLWYNYIEGDFSDYDI